MKLLSWYKNYKEERRLKDLASITYRGWGNDRETDYQELLQKSNLYCKFYTDLFIVLERDFLNNRIKVLKKIVYIKYVDHGITCKSDDLCKKWLELRVRIYNSNKVLYNSNKVLDPAFDLAKVFDRVKFYDPNSKDKEIFSGYQSGENCF